MSFYDQQARALHYVAGHAMLISARIAEAAQQQPTYLRAYPLVAVWWCWSRLIAYPIHYLVNYATRCEGDDDET